MNITTRYAAAAVLALGLLAGLAPQAAADERPLPPSKATCGWTTCTAYWSVERTDEFDSGWKGAVDGIYGGQALATATALGVATASTGGAAAVPAAVVGGAIGAGLLYKSKEFDVQISQAASDGRCLIYKFPRGAPSAGWWGSVSPSNKNCD